MVEVLVAYAVLATIWLADRIQQVRYLREDNEELAAALEQARTDRRVLGNALVAEVEEAIERGC